MISKQILSSVIIGSMFLALPAFADGIEVPRTIEPSSTNTYVLRAVLSTTNDVRNLNYGIYEFRNGSVGDEIPDVVKRPNTINTTAGVKRPVLFIIDKNKVKSDQLAVCMFTVPPKASEVKSSQFISNFRYCKVFNLKVK